MNQIIQGDCLTVLRDMVVDSIHCCVTSPPYWGLRDYGVEGQLGLERTPEEYVTKMVEVFREVRRVLRADGTIWLNMGDSYAHDIKGSGGGWANDPTNYAFKAQKTAPRRCEHGLKPKDLVGIPWRVAFTLQADGWYLRQDIIWCLSGGTWLYARTPSGHTLTTIKDLARLDPATVQLWSGSRWTQLLGMSKSKRRGDEIEIVLRSGERIACTPTHRFPTQRGVVDAGQIKAGDVLARCLLPEPDAPRDCAIDADAAWFAGLYLAEGSRSGDTIQISGHAREDARWRRVEAVARKFGGSATRTVDGNCMDVRVYGRVLNAIIDTLVSGRTARDKAIAPVVWRYSNAFLGAYLDGYLAGDGCFDATNNRWRLGFVRNYSLERDLRAACARLGYTLTLKLSISMFRGVGRPAFRGEIRMERSGHHNERDMGEVVEVRRARCREVYDIGVADDPHTFALASGVLTHNSKPNPMPESVTDRCTKAHEYVFLMAKSERYFYDAEAVKETSVYPDDNRKGRAHVDQKRMPNEQIAGVRPGSATYPTRNRRSVWTIPTQSFKGAHFATFPEKLVEPCILAGCPGKVCSTCGAPHERIVNRVPETSKECPKTQAAHEARGGTGVPVGTVGKSGGGRIDGYTETLGWKPTCNCNAGTSSGTVLDPFGGSGTVGVVAKRLKRNFILIELNPEYCTMARARIDAEPPTLF